MTENHFQWVNTLKRSPSHQPTPPPSGFASLMARMSSGHCRHNDTHYSIMAGGWTFQPPKIFSVVATRGVNILTDTRVTPGTPIQAQRGTLQRFHSRPAMGRDHPHGRLAMTVRTFATIPNVRATVCMENRGPIARHDHDGSHTRIVVRCATGVRGRVPGPTNVHAASHAYGIQAWRRASGHDRDVRPRRILAARSRLRAALSRSSSVRRGVSAMHDAWLSTRPADTVPRGCLSKNRRVSI